MSKKFITTWFYAALETKKEYQQKGFLGLKEEIVSTPEAKVANWGITPICVKIYGYSVNYFFAINSIDYGH